MKKYKKVQIERAKENDHLTEERRRKFAVSAWVWQADYSSNDYEPFKKARKMGYEGIEIPTFDGYLKIDQIRNALDSVLTPIVIGGGSPRSDISSEDPIVRSDGIAYTKRLVKSCSDLGGNLVCGPLYAAVGALKHLSEDEQIAAYERVSQSFGEIGKFSKELNVKIALEPLCRYDTHLVNTTKQMMKLVEMIDQKNVGVLLDSFHLNIEEKSLYEAISTASDKLFHFHACENDRGTPGSGHINWDEVSSALDKIDYKDWISIEAFTPYNPSFSSAMRTWRKIESGQDEIALKGLAFLKRKLG
ncbi:MAG: sugar phosphate isomerase/epimerase family protein [Nitrososphaerales archaeon]